MRNATANCIKVCHTFYKYRPTWSTHLASLQNMTLLKSFHIWVLGLANSINSSFMGLPKFIVELKATESNYRSVSNITAYQWTTLLQNQWTTLSQNLIAIFRSTGSKAVKSLESSSKFVYYQVSFQKFYLLVESLSQEHKFYQQQNKFHYWLAPSSTHPLLMRMSYVFISQSYNQITTCTIGYWMQFVSLKVLIPINWLINPRIFM